MKLSRYLRSGLQGSKIPQDEINNRIIYANPTTAGLAGSLKSLSTGINAMTNGMGSEANRERIMGEVLRRCLDGLPTSKKTKETPLRDGLTVLLTGTTGSLGSYLLDPLAKSFKVGNFTV